MADRDQREYPYKSLKSLANLNDDNETTKKRGAATSIAIDA